MTDYQYATTKLRHGQNIQEMIHAANMKIAQKLAEYLPCAEALQRLGNIGVLRIHYKLTTGHATYNHKDSCDSESHSLIGHGANRQLTTTFSGTRPHMVLDPHFWLASGAAHTAHSMNRLSDQCVLVCSRKLCTIFVNFVQSTV